MHFGLNGKLKANTSYTISSTFEQIDKAIQQGAVQDWKSTYVPLHKRYMIKYWFLNKVRAHSTKLFPNSQVYKRRQAASTTDSISEIHDYYHEWPAARNVSDAWLKENKLSRHQYELKSQKERKRRWSELRACTAYRQAVRGKEPARTPTPGCSAAAPPSSFPTTPSPNKRLAAVLFVEVYKINSLQRPTAFFILEQLTLVEHRRQGYMTALHHALAKVCLSMPGTSRESMVQLIVRKSSKQQRAARQFDSVMGFSPVAPQCCIHSPQSWQLCLGSSVGTLEDKGVQVANSHHCQIVCQHSFNKMGTPYERAAAHAIGQQHMCDEGDHVHVNDLVPHQQLCAPIVLFAFT